MILSKFKLKGKKALVTGGNTGIGLGIAKGLAEAGASVAICARNKEKNKNALLELEKIKHGCRAYSVDLENTLKIEHFFNKAEKEMDGFDILVNNAGMHARGRADVVKPKDLERIIKVNLTAPFVLSQCFARKRMEKELPGSIIMIASLMSESSRPGTSAYTATKGGIRQLVKAMATDWAHFNIRVNGIGPGYIKTDMTRPLFEDTEFDKWVVKRTPMERWGMPDDLAGAAVFLASEASGFITGQIIYTDGGWLATF